MNDISSVLPMLSQMLGTPQNSLPPQLQQLVNAAGNNPANNTANNSVTDFLTLSPAALSLQQLLNSEMSNGGQGGDASSEFGLTELAQLKSQGELAATLINAKMQKGLAAPAHEKIAQQYARQSEIQSINSPNVNFVRHIIEGK